MTNMAFQISVEDVICAGRTHFGLEWDEDQANVLMDTLDCELIEEAALNGGCGMDEQTEAAIGEIALQLYCQKGFKPLLSSLLSKIKTVGEQLGHLKEL